MKTVNIHEAKTHLSKLLRLVQEGEEVIIAKYGEPIAELKPAKPKQNKVKFGIWKDKDFVVPENFDDPDPEILEMFYGGEIFPK